MTQPTNIVSTDESDTPDGRASILTEYQRDRVLMSIASVTAFVICWWAGKYFLVPHYKGFSASLLAQPAWFVNSFVVAVAFALCALLGTLVAGRVRPDAGVFAACIGWLAFTARGGPMRTTIQSAAGPGLFLVLIVEMILLTIIAVSVSAAVQYMRRTRAMEEAVESELEHQEVSTIHKIIAMGFQTVVMGVIVFFLAQSDAKLQAIMAVAVGAFAATALAGEAFDVMRMDFWYFTGPTVVAIAGYALAFFDPEGFAIGFTNQSMARALPLDYASAGFAGAILGSWLGTVHPLHTIEWLVKVLTGRDPMPMKTHKPARG